MAQKLKRLWKLLNTDVGELFSGELEIDDAEAKKAIVCFHESKLATAFNGVLSARLQQAGLDVSTAEILTERVARNTHRYIKVAVAAGEKVKPLAELYGNRVGVRHLNLYTIVFVNLCF